MRFFTSLILVCFAVACGHDVNSSSISTNNNAETYNCSNVGGTAEWTISVDLKKKLAGFFNNDTTVVIPLKYVRSLETRPPQMVYTFEGNDTESRGEKMQIRFNETKLKASVTFSLGRRDEKTLEAKDGCQRDKDVDLEK